MRHPYGDRWRNVNRLLKELPPLLCSGDPTFTVCMRDILMKAKNRTSTSLHRRKKMLINQNGSHNPGIGRSFVHGMGYFCTDWLRVDYLLVSGV